jgi:cell division protein FtsL
MTEFVTVKQIDNSRLVRAAAPHRVRECARMAAICAALASVILLYAWQHFEYLQLRVQLEELKGKKAQAIELNQQLHLNVAGLRSPMRIDAIARGQLGLSVPVPGVAAPAPAPAASEFARFGGPVQARTAPQDSQ